MATQQINVRDYARASSSTSSIELVDQSTTHGAAFRPVQADDPDDPNEPPPPLTKVEPSKKMAVLELWFRAMGLSLVLKIFRRKKLEEPKQAMHRGLWTAIFTLLAAHLLPVTAALLIVSLNIRGYYVGGELAGEPGFDDAKLGGLQFAAKLHELTMLASLSFIVVGLIRHELVAGEGIPFGAIFGSLQFSNVSYLWSKEFAGTLRAKFATKIIKVRLLALLIVGSILALTVGPSSAVAMRPRVANWPAGGSDFWLNATESQIWPTYLDTANIPTSCSNISIGTNCISRDWEFSIYQLLAFWPDFTDRSTMPELVQVNSPLSLRQMSTRETQGLYPNFAPVATTQMSNLADALTEIGRLWTIAAHTLWLVSNYPRRFMYRNDATYSIKNVYQPVTAAMCRSHRNISELSDMLLNNRLEVPVVSSLCSQTYTSSNYSIEPSKSEEITRYLDGSIASPNLQFMDLPFEVFGNSTVGAIITFPPSWPGGVNLVTCGVDARWANTTIQSTRNVLKLVTGAPEGWQNRMCTEPWPFINVTSGWAQYLNPWNQDTNKSIFETLLESVGTRNSSWQNDEAFVHNVIETILITAITNGLARTASTATMQGELKDCLNDTCDQLCTKWCLSIMPPKNKEFGKGSSIFDLSSVPPNTTLTKFTVEVEVNGYAYNIRGVAMILSCVVLTCYSALALIHCVFVLITRSSSTSWDTVSEVTALAMQSQPTSFLKNTCAGISTTKTFTHLVKVVRTGEDGDHLELDFGDRDVGGYGEPLIEDEFYK